MTRHRSLGQQCESPFITVICCAHNEEAYVDISVPHLLRALEDFSAEIIFVADRCTDSTVERVGKYRVTIIEKDWQRWENSYAESLQTGYLRARGTYVALVDADIALTTDFFKDLLPVITGKTASVAANVVTYADTFWNRVMYAWEKSHNIAPLGREPRGAARIILKSALNAINGFRDVPTPDSDVDIRLAEKGYTSKAKPAVKVYHLRHLTLGKMMIGQINSGRGRYSIGVSLIRTIGHSIIRLRPFVISGWFLESRRSRRHQGSFAQS